MEQNTSSELTNLELFLIQVIIHDFEVNNMKQKEMYLKFQMFDLPLKLISKANLDEDCRNNLESGVEFFIRLDCFQAFQQTPLYIYLSDSKKKTHCACGFDLCTTLVEAYQNSGKKFTYQLNIPLENKNQTHVGSITIEYSLVHYSSNVDEIICLDKEPEKIPEPQKAPEPVKRKPKPKKKRELPLVNPREADVYQLNLQYRNTREQLKRELLDLERKVRTIEDSRRRQKIRRLTEIEDLTAHSSRRPSMYEDPLNQVEIIPKPQPQPQQQVKNKDSSSNSALLSKPIRETATMSHISRPGSRAHSEEQFERPSVIQEKKSKESSKISVGFDSDDTSSFEQILSSAISADKPKEKTETHIASADSGFVSSSSYKSNKSKPKSKSEQSSSKPEVQNNKKSASSSILSDKSTSMDSESTTLSNLVTVHADSGSDLGKSIKNPSVHSDVTSFITDNTDMSSGHSKHSDSSFSRASKKSGSSISKKNSSVLSSDTDSDTFSKISSSSKAEKASNSKSIYNSILNDTTSTLPSFMKSTMKSTLGNDNDKKESDVESSSILSHSSSKKSSILSGKTSSSRNASAISGKNSRVSGKSGINDTSDIISGSFA